MTDFLKGRVTFHNGYIYLSNIKGLPRFLEDHGKSSSFLEPGINPGEYCFPSVYLPLSYFASVSSRCLAPESEFRLQRRISYLEGIREKNKERYDALVPSNPEDLKGFFLLLNERPFLYQQAALEIIKKQKRVLLGDDQGLGKTITSLVSVYHLYAFPCLIVCPNNVKFSWPVEALDWLPHIKVTCLQNKESKPVESKRRDGSSVLVPINDWSADIFVINYKILPEFSERLANFGFRGCIIDESHNIKNRETQAFQSLKPIMKGVDVRIAMSGTPIPNRPEEILPQLELIGREKDLGGRGFFEEEFCKLKDEEKVVSTAIQQRLHDELSRSGFFIRRLKKNALPTLSEKQRILEKVSLDNEDEYRAAHNDFNQWLLDNHDEATGKTHSKHQGLVRINKLKELCAKGKLRSVFRWIWSFLEGSEKEKLLVFAYHKSVLDQLQLEFEDECYRIDGAVKAEERERIKHQFADPDGRRLIFAGLKAANAGITLHANGLCRTVLTIELYWTAATHEQAEDRVHRIGQPYDVSCITIIGRNTIEEEIYALIRQKSNQSAQILSGEESEEASEVSLFAALGSSMHAKLKEEGMSS